MSVRVCFLDIFMVWIDLWMSTSQETRPMGWVANHDILYVTKQSYV